jgi:hypothetical protein
VNWTPDPRDPSAPYFVRSGPFILCKAMVNGTWVYTASRAGQLLHSGTREDCEAACASFSLPPNPEVASAPSHPASRPVQAKSRGRP